MSSSLRWCECVTHFRVDTYMEKPVASPDGMPFFPRYSSHFRMEMLSPLDIILWILNRPPTTGLVSGIVLSFFIFLSILKVVDNQPLSLKPQISRVSESDLLKKISGWEFILPDYD